MKEVDIESLSREQKLALLASYERMEEALKTAIKSTGDRKKRIQEKLSEMERDRLLSQETE